MTLQDRFDDGSVFSTTQRSRMLEDVYAGCCPLCGQPMPPHTPRRNRFALICGSPACPGTQGLMALDAGLSHELSTLRIRVVMMNAGASGECLMCGLPARENRLTCGEQCYHSLMHFRFRYPWAVELAEQYARWERMYG